jgi:diacylglycerol kinase (ATP)
MWHYRFFKSVTIASQGLIKAWRDELNFRLEIIIAFIVVIAAYLLGAGHLALAIIILACALVIALELINTIVELISDAFKPRLDQYVKHIKDLTAAAVFIAALGSIGVAICLIWPLLAHLLWR